MKTKNKQIVRAASIKGPLHEAKKMPCQDYYKHSGKGKNFVAVVSDGAGSAKHSKIGSRVVCETLVDLLVNCDFKDARACVIKALDIARGKVLMHRFNKTKSEKHINDFAATVVGVVHNNGRGIFFHLGDGAGIAFCHDNMKNFVISRPENGRFACETFFYTMQDWKHHLRFTPFEGENTILLMSDGVSNFALTKDHKKIEECFVVPINNFLIKEKVKTKAVRALMSTLSNERAAKLNSDDKTLLWAKL